MLAIGLLVPTLFRRIAIRKGISGNLPSIMWTTYTMDVFSYISVMYLLYVFSTWLKAYSGISISVPFLFGIFTPLFSIGLLVVQELTIKDALKEAQRIFQTQSIEYGGSVSGAYLSIIAQISGSRRVDLKHSNSQQSELRDFTRSKSLEDLNEEEVWILVKSAYVISRTCHRGAHYLIYILCRRYLPLEYTVVCCALLLISTLSVSVLVGLWFSKLRSCPSRGPEWVLPSPHSSVQLLLYWLFDSLKNRSHANIPVSQYLPRSESGKI